VAEIKRGDGGGTKYEMMMKSKLNDEIKIEVK
jgi:hypothetical protein